MKFFNPKNSQKNNLVAAMLLSLTAGMSITGHAAATNVTPQSQAMHSTMEGKHHGMNAEQRYQKMRANDLAAANARISAVQAVSLVQQQLPNSQILAVHYSNGQHRGFHNNQNTSTTPAVKSPYYHIMAIKADGKPQMMLVDATTGQVTQKDMQKWAKKANQTTDKSQADGTAMMTKQLIAPAISVSKAMQLAGDKVGGKVIGVQFGYGKHQGGRQGGKGVAPQPNQPAQNITAKQVSGQPKARNYRVKVVKGQDVYLVKVNAQTGEVSEARLIKAMPTRAAGQQALPN